MRSAEARRGRRGSTTVEFALLVPPLLLLAMAGTDVVNFMRSQMRLDSAALQLGQLVSQCNRITSPGDTEQFWAYAQRIVGGLGSVSGATAQGAVIISSVGVVNGANRVAWQQRSGNAAHASVIGAAGDTAVIPGGLVVPSGQTLFVTEVIMPREPWPLAGVVMGGNTTRVLRGRTSFMTRATDAPALQQPPVAITQPSCTA